MTNFKKPYAVSEKGDWKWLSSRFREGEFRS
jgi:hypothetical protein